LKQIDSLLCHPTYCLYHSSSWGLERQPRTGAWAWGSWLGASSLNHLLMVWRQQ